MKWLTLPSKPPSAAIQDESSPSHAIKRSSDGSHRTGTPGAANTLLALIMASRPGLLTEWPWQRLGNFKYVVLAPWALHGLYLLATQERKKWDLAYLLILPSLLLRMVHSQVWISISRFQNARSKHHRIVDKSLEFEQVDRERNWDDQIIFNGLLFYLAFMYIPSGRNLPLWRSDGALLIALLHMGPVEFLYYWFHRALHHHFLYTRYHSHHHASIVTEPITSVIHPFAEHIVYFLLFSIPTLTATLCGTASIISMIGYIAYIDFMNNLGHCNFEIIPKWLFTVFPPLKYLMYTPSFHSLHHTQFRVNYSLFMPFYDYVYGTVDKSSDLLYESALEGKEEQPDVVHLTHLTSFLSIYHLRVGFASLASKPYDPKTPIFSLWPLAWISIIFMWINDSFTVERNSFEKVKMQTWALPRFKFQYGLLSARDAINDLVEKAILEADNKGIKFLTLELLNQAQELNGSGELYLQKYPKLKLRIVDGSSLAAAIVVNSIPPETRKVILTGNQSKVAYRVTIALCQKGVEVTMRQKNDYYMIKSQLPENASSFLLLSNDCNAQVWLVGDGLEDIQQRRAPKGTLFIPFSWFPTKKVRKDCIYYTTPAMKIPKTFENMHSCENWLPRRVMSASRIAGIVHALEGWNSHECGDNMQDLDKMWAAALRHGFLPVN
ncbi:hypothetical protein ZIOFF_039245 [Zingiber officinale]|uniref:aldehyde oxygenase (deformylating) n=2 Tax=Zingiber officinale TaxID=94328 RepID=A0A8J5GFP4_ZINOF|nr:hypothetical protein ZIOFF_039245 [Zingiber officinale]